MNWRSRIKNTLLVCAVGYLLIAAGFSADVWAFGKKKPPDLVAIQPAPPAVGRKVIGIVPVQEVKIQLPDGNWKDFGEAYEVIVRSDLERTKKYITTRPHEKAGAMSALSVESRAVWTGTNVPAATVRISVDALTFVTGSRGDRMFYGFDERFRTPFNDGNGKNPNEFPLKSLSFEPNWFDRQFDAKGTAPMDSLSGLDLGQGFDLNVLFAWLSVK